MPQDKLFALVGMARENTDANLKRLIDYTRPVEAVLLNLANYLLDTEQALEVLDLAGLRQRGRNPKLPSWAVDWTAMRAGIPLNSKFLPLELLYHATKAEPARVQRGSSRQELVVSGQCIDRIAWLVPLPEIWPIIGISAAARLSSHPDKPLSLARKHVRDPYPHWGNGQPLEEAVWRTLIGNKTHTVRPAPHTLAAHARRSGALEPGNSLREDLPGGDA